MKSNTKFDRCAAGYEHSYERSFISTTMTEQEIEELSARYQNMTDDELKKEESKLLSELGPHTKVLLSDKPNFSGNPNVIVQETKKTDVTAEEAAKIREARARYISGVASHEDLKLLNVDEF
jgi:hypothetical protein